MIRLNLVSISVAQIAFDFIHFCFIVLSMDMICVIMFHIYCILKQNLFFFFTILLRDQLILYNDRFFVGNITNEIHGKIYFIPFASKSMKIRSKTKKLCEWQIAIEISCIYSDSAWNLTLMVRFSRVTSLFFFSFSSIFQMFISFSHRNLVH